MNRPLLSILTLPVFTVLALSIASCGKKETATTDPGPRKVTVAVPESKDLTAVIDTTGTLAASETVNLVARVQGELQKVGFKDGAHVKAGQLLFQIDDAPFVEKVKLYEAQFTGAESEYNRQLALAKENATSVANVEDWRSKRDQAAAQVALAKIDLSYTKIAAPFDGRIGKRLVDPGNIVGPGTQSGENLAQIEATNPTYVEFEISEGDLLKLRDTIGTATWPDAFVKTGEVQIGLSDDTSFDHTAKIDFVDTSLSTSTGTINFRATMPNPDGTLVPGLFARIRLPVGTPVTTLLISINAIGTDQQGDFVLVVGEDSTLVRKSVVPGARYGTMKAVTGELTANDQVVTYDVSDLRPGDKVSPQDTTATKSSGTPAAATPATPAK